MSGFKSWNTSSNTIFNNNNNGAVGNNGGGDLIRQWGETSTTLFTNKKVLTTSTMEAASFDVNSDVRLKNSIKSLSKQEIQHLDKLKHIIPKSYNLNNKEKKTFGFIAQEMEKIYPNLVNTNNKGIKSIDYIQLIPLLLLQSNNLERKIEELKNNN
tara:strand:+ start:9327 stop:9794 length:468 start_codon:yes stop_codon:yes gene_type:complete